jgi:RNA polymerase sigma-70 factor (ECF subfamily)
MTASEPESRSTAPSTEGDADLQALWPEAYQELRAVAARLLMQERPGHTLVPTALVNEAYLRLNAQRTPAPVRDRQHFFALAAGVMRRILVDHALARKADKRGAGAVHISLAGAAERESRDSGAELLGLHQALEALERVDPRAARVTELKVFGGLETLEIAAVLAVSEPTVKRDWAYAKVWLARELSG